MLSPLRNYVAAGLVELSSQNNRTAINGFRVIALRPPQHCSSRPRQMESSRAVWPSMISVSGRCGEETPFRRPWLRRLRTWKSPGRERCHEQMGFNPACSESPWPKCPLPLPL